MQLRNQVPKAPPRPIYAATVVALTVFFCGLALFQPTSSRFVITSKIGMQWAPGNVNHVIGTPPRNMAPKVLVQEVADAIRAADCQTGRRSGGERSSVLSSQRVKSIASNISLSENGETASSRQYALTFTGGEEMWALAFVDQLARRLLAARPNQGGSGSKAGEQRRRAKWLVQQARHYERKARFDMEDALNAHLQLAANGAGTERDLRPSGPTAIGQLDKTEAPTRPLNPAWKQLSGKRVELQHTLDELMTTVTPDHPLARQANLQLEQLRQQLAATPRYLATPRHDEPSLRPGQEGAAAGAAWGARQTTFASDSMPVGAPSDRGESGGAPLASSPPTYEYLHALYEKAIAERENAEQQYTQLAALQQVASHDDSIGTAYIVEPATLVQRVGGGPSGRNVLVSGMAAVICGLLMLWRVSSLHGLNYIGSVRDLQSSIALPLVGRISIDPIAPSVGRQARWGSLTRGCTRAGELFLLAIVVLFLISALGDSPMSKEFATNPFGTIVHHVLRSVKV